MNSSEPARHAGAGATPGPVPAPDPTPAPHPNRPPDLIQAPGTDEALWRAWDGWADLPPAVLPAGPVVVVAAHPDDEVLGAGGALALLAAAGRPLTVVGVTAGEGSHPRTRVLRPPALAARRAAELRAALTALGAQEARTVCLRVPDTAVAAHEEEVRRALVPLTAGASLVLAPWARDAHPDHEATGRAARAAARETGAPTAAYPVWMWHWARPGDPRVPWHRAVRLDLPAEVRARKREAVACFRSQIAPLGPAPEDAAILPPAELAHHLRDFEVWFA